MNALYHAAIPQDILNRIYAKIDQTVARANAFYSRNLKPITNVRFDKKGRTAGTATYRTRTVNFNKVLLMENVDAFINRTVPHEVAHVLAYDLFLTEGMGHGARWKEVMNVVGADPSRCHTYDTTNSQVRTKNKFRYVCDCGENFTVGPVLHKKIQNGSTHYCRKCKTFLRSMPFRALGQVTYKQAAEAPVVDVSEPPKPAARKIQPSKTANGSKKERAIALYSRFLMQHNRAPSRQEMMSLLMNELNMTKAGASTYASNVKKWALEV